MDRLGIVLETESPGFQMNETWKQGKEESRVTLRFGSRAEQAGAVL